MKPSELVGIPYENRGRSLEGLDCWGLVLYCLRHCYCVPIVDSSGPYASATDEAAWRQIEAGWADWRHIPIGYEQPGDVLAFRGAGHRHAIHCGVAIGEGRFIHTLSGRLTCIERHDVGIWSKLLVRIGRWKS